MAYPDEYISELQVKLRDDDTAVLRPEMSHRQGFEKIVVTGSETASDETNKYMPIGKLTVHLFVEVLSYLPSADLLRCSTVNKIWRNQTLDTPSLWKSLSISGYTPHPHRKIGFWANRQSSTNKKLKELRLGCNVNHSTFSILSEMGMVEQLQVLRLDTSFRGQAAAKSWEFASRRASLRRLVMCFSGGFEFGQDLRSVLAKFPELEELVLAGGSAYVRFDSNGEVPAINSATPYAPSKLLRLRLRNVDTCSANVPSPISILEITIPTLEHIEIVQDRCVLMPRQVIARHPPLTINWAQLPNLRTLRLAFCSHRHRIKIMDSLILTAFPSLESLVILDRSSPSAPAAINALPIRAPLLRRLELSGKHPDKILEFLTTNVGHFPVLEILEISDVNLAQVSNSLDTVFEGLPQLTHIKFAGTGFTDVRAESLFKHWSTLVSLNVSQCSDVAGSVLVRLVHGRTNPQGGRSGLTELPMSGCAGFGRQDADRIKEQVDSVVDPGP